MVDAGQGDPDAIRVLTQLFLEHPVWCSAAHYLEEGATSDVYVTTHPGEAWHLERRGGETRLLRGTSPAPDFVFRFTPGAVDALAAVQGGIGSFAAELFHLIADGDPDRSVEIRVVAPFSVLIRRGYLTLLAAGGPRVLSAGAAHGVRSVRDLRRLVERVRRRLPEAWEGAPRFLCPGPDPDQSGLHLRLRRAAREIAGQHDRIRQLHEEIDTAVSEAGASAALRRYRDALVAHFQVEKEMLFPALHGLSPESAAAIEALEAEHVHFDRSLEGLIRREGAVRDADWKAELHVLRRATARHEAREEALFRSIARED